MFLKFAHKITQMFVKKKRKTKKPKLAQRHGCQRLHKRLKYMRLLLLGGEYHLRLFFAAAFLGLMRQLGIHAGGAVHHKIHLMMLRPGQRPGRRRRGCTKPRLGTARTRHVLGIATVAAAAAWTARCPHAAHRHVLVHERVRVHRRLAFYRDLEKKKKK